MIRPSCQRNFAFLIFMPKSDRHASVSFYLQDSRDRRQVLDRSRAHGIHELSAQVRSIGSLELHFQKKSDDVVPGHGRDHYGDRG